MSHNRNHRNHSQKAPQPRLNSYEADQAAAVHEACMECSQCAGTIHPLHAMGIPLVTEQEVLVNMLTRTGMPFTFAPTEESPEDDGKVIAVHLNTDGGPFMEDQPSLDLMFFFNENGYCTDAVLG